MKNTPTIKLVIFDLDGTVYLGGKLIPGAKRFLKKLDAAGIDYAFMTNNSSIAPGQYRTKLRNLGLRVTPNNVLTSCQATCLMLTELNLGPEIFLLGTKKFQNYLAKQGYTHTDRDPKAVIIGFDKELTFEKFTTAIRLVDKGVPLLASHPDVLCPSPDGPLVDAGCILAAIKAATNVTPIAIAGKPHRWIIKLARQNFNVKPSQIAVVGDRLQTDMKMAKRYKMHSILTLTGVTKQHHLKASSIKPDLVVKSIAELTEKFWF